MSDLLPIYSAIFQGREPTESEIDRAVVLHLLETGEAKITPIDTPFMRMIARKAAEEEATKNEG